MQWLSPFQVFVAAVLFVVHVCFANESYTTRTTACAGVLAALTYLTLVRFVVQRVDRIPWLEAFLFIHYTEFGLGVFAEIPPMGVFRVRPTAASYEHAETLALVSAFAIIAGWKLMGELLSHVNLRFLLPELSPKGIASGLGLFVPISIVVIVSTTLVPSAREALGSMLAPFEAVFNQRTLLLVTTYAHLVCHSKFTRAMLVAALVTLLIRFASTSMLGEMILPLAFAGVLRWLMTRKIPVVGLVVVSLLMVVLQPVKLYYRSLRWDTEQRWMTETKGSTVDGWVDAYENWSVDSQSSHGTTKESNGQVLSRVTELKTVAYLIDVVPHSFPHTGGLAYTRVLEGWIPRVFWPEKPTNMTAYGHDVFVVETGLLSAENAKSTTVGLTLLGQGYVEHGAMGAIAWMMGYAALVRCISLLFLGGGVATLAGLIVLPHIAEVGSGIMSAAGAIPAVLVSCVLTMWILALPSLMSAFGRGVPLRTLRRRAT